MAINDGYNVETTESEIDASPYRVFKQCSCEQRGTTTMHIKLKTRNVQSLPDWQYIQYWIDNVYQSAKNPRRVLNNTPK